MKRKNQRLLFLGLAVALGAGGVLLALGALKDNIVYFYTPSELATETPGAVMRLGGLVEKGSVTAEGSTVHFRVTDYQAETTVEYHGLLPGLFREGQGVVAEGRLRADGIFQASNVLAKHDEYYMPPEVARALKASGHWKTQYGKPGG